MVRLAVAIASVLLAASVRAEAPSPDAAAPAAHPVPAAAPALSPEECAVFRAEAAFARSVAQRDRAAFAAFVHPDAVFSGGGAPAKGRDAVVAAWEFAFDPAQPVLHWAPSSVAIGARADLALSRGPYWIENTAPGAPHRLVAGEFTSVWTRGDDGEWKVLFDGGSSAAPLSAEALHKRLAALPTPCD